MKHSQAEKYIRDALWCVQHIRSVAEEDIVGDNPVMRAVTSDLIPWVYDEQKTLLHPLLKIVERIDDGGKMTCMEFYNIMFVIWRFADIVNIQLMMSTQGVDSFPEPDINWLRGWDAE